MTVSNAVLFRIIGIVIALLWIVLLSFALPSDPDATQDETGFPWRAFLIESKNDQMYPFNLQVFMWIAFFLCVAELLIKWFGLQAERVEMSQFDLYNNPSAVTVHSPAGSQKINLDPREALKPELIAAIFYAKKDITNQDSLIGQMFKNVNHQFHSTNDVADVYSAVTSMIELRLHEVDLRYTVVRYIAWLIPTLGFIGTVVGIVLALGDAGKANPDLAVIVSNLGVAFFTTLLALLLSAIVMILLQVIQAQDEQTVNEVGKFCLDHIVTNLKPRSGG